MKLSLGQKIRIAGYTLQSIITKPVFWSFNPRKQSFLDNPFPVYRRMQKEHPIFWSPITSSWHISLDYDGTLQMLRDDRFTLSFRDWMFAPTAAPESSLDKLLDALLVTIPVSDHARVRRLVSPAFSPRFVDKAKPQVEAIVQDLLKSCYKDGKFDVIAYCRGIPTEALAIYIGIPAGQRDEFAALGDAILRSFDAYGKIDETGAERAIVGIKKLMAVKRAQPDDSFLSTMVNHVEDGDRISEDEALGLIGALIAAGVDTTFDYMTHAIFALAKNPSWAAWLRDNPEKIQDFLDETIRWQTFGHRGFMRFVREDFTILGKTIKKGEIVQFMAMPGNCDEILFREHEIFNPTRDNLDKVFVFGYGAHYCLGHALAKLISHTALLGLVNHFTDISVQEEPVREYNMVSRRMKTFEIALQKSQ